MLIELGRMPDIICIVDASVISIFDAHFPHLKDGFKIGKMTFDAEVIVYVNINLILWRFCDDF